eukprot:78823-Chlamydomonas_euryale.AAC.15
MMPDWIAGVCARFRCPEADLPLGGAGAGGFSYASPLHVADLQSRNSFLSARKSCPSSALAQLRLRLLATLCAARACVHVAPLHVRGCMLLRAACAWVHVGLPAVCTKPRLAQTPAMQPQPPAHPSRPPLRALSSSRHAMRSLCWPIWVWCCTSTLERSTPRCWEASWVRSRASSTSSA